MVDYAFLTHLGLVLDLEGIANGPWLGFIDGTAAARGRAVVLPRSTTTVPAVLAAMEVARALLSSFVAALRRDFSISRDASLTLW